MSKAIKLPRKIKKGLKRAYFNQGISRAWKMKEFKILNVKRDSKPKKGKFYVTFKGYRVVHSTLG